ncbi:hypothetical protein BDP55DRAFT_632002 [Colletotrichum godetiae]|uniref:CBM-cenC domain-containing protein n=1 Tax=Colletotrichum godetiae TaxID=1209918 RepID=A0AAJ0EY28_9PEZI|nr:uncharacterized protein BDP55DRAFT_632002 [Colletotrichum godetiae]KAK1675820.1 hypothetical protein BDP55DRAFT_632002 [Colletotrichum godetiae]
MMISTALSVLLGVLAIRAHATTTLAQCNADNCYRALFPCPSPSAVSSASAFCATLTAGGITATNLPTRATSACGTSVSRYISACACGPTCTPSSTPPCGAPSSSSGNLLTNSDFECGIAPWIVQNLDRYARVGVTSAASHTGTHAFESRLLYDRNSQDPVVSVRLSTPVFSVQPGVPYKLIFWSYFDNQAAGFIGIQFNGEPKRTLDAGDLGGWGVWKVFEVEYTPVTDKLDITLEFLYGRVASVVRVDGVEFGPLH